MAEILFRNNLTSINYSDLLFYDRVLNERHKTQIYEDFIQELLFFFADLLSGAKKSRFILGHQGTYRPGGKRPKRRSCTCI